MSDSDLLDVECNECDTQFTSEYGGTFTCPNCDSESVQEYVTGYIGLNGPHTIKGWAEDE